MVGGSKRPQHSKAGPATDCGLDSILIGFFVSCLDAAVVATSMVSISGDLNDFTAVPWVILAYLLSYMGTRHPLAP